MYSAFHLEVPFILAGPYLPTCIYMTCLLYIKITVLVPFGPHKLLKSLGFHRFMEKSSLLRLLFILHKSAIFGEKMAPLCETHCIFVCILVTLHFYVFSFHLYVPGVIFLTHIPQFLASLTYFIFCNSILLSVSFPSSIFFEMLFFCKPLWTTCKTYCRVGLVSKAVVLKWANLPFLGIWILINVF